MLKIEFFFEKTVKPCDEHVIRSLVYPRKSRLNLDELSQSPEFSVMDNILLTVTDYGHYGISGCGVFEAGIQN